jgi:DNA-binding MarR family transcriptional regulator
MPENPSSRVAYLMRMTAQTLSQQLERTLRPLGLTHAQLGALALLALNPSRGLSGSELSQHAGVTAQAMSSAIASLDERHLVRRTPHPTHGRVVVVWITDDGLTLLEQAQQATKRIEDRALAGLDDDERHQLKALVLRMMENLDLPIPDRVG